MAPARAAPSSSPMPPPPPPPRSISISGATMTTASSVRAFVKRGEESDHVRLSLRSQSQASDIHITRKVDTNNKSEWLLDGTSVPKKDIIDVIKKFNIQINNLTQFLPQDRVCEFAKLTPIQLLEETEKAVGDPNLPVQHRQLIERSRELRNIEVSDAVDEQVGVCEASLEPFQLFQSHKESLKSGEAVEPGHQRC
ncbi:hypothetical protein ZWY2020_040559 [Hordeum vulgare]|nr:hypothetical protein ZWY2020_040559 [Hordeum vulgare]